MPILIFLYVLLLLIFLIITVFVFRYIVKFSYLSPRFTNIVFIFAGIALLVIALSAYFLFKGLSSSSSSTTPHTPSSSSSSGGLSF